MTPDVKRRFNRAVEALMDQYTIDQEEISREDAEKMIMDYALTHDGYFDLVDEAKQKGEYKTRKQYAEAQRAEFEGTVRERNAKKKKKAAKMSDRDLEYMDAVNRGDMETAQRMVNEAAREAGYTVKGYHGTATEFTVFDKSRINSVWGANGGDLGFYFTPLEADAKEYARFAASGGTGRVVNAFLKMENPLIVEDDGWGSAARQADIRNGDLKRWAKQGNHDGIIVRSMDEEIEDGVPDTVFVVFDSEQIKSADPVTYDDNGNVIPLSERFDSSKGDIRYSIREIVGSDG